MFSRHTFCLRLALVLLLSACRPENTEAPAPGAGNEAALPDIGTLQIAYVPVLPFTPLFVAEEKNYFAEQGLRVNLQRVRNVDEMLAPLGTGQLDLSVIAPTTGFFNAMYQALDVRVIAGANAMVSTGDPILMVRKALAESGAVKTVADLKGPKLAINLKGNIMEYLLAKGLEQSGLTLDDVELVTIPGPEMLTALANSAVDGAVTAGSNAQRMINEGVAVKLLADTDIMQGGQGGVVVAGQRLLQPANREIAIRVLAAYLKAVHDLNDNGWNKPEIIGIIQKYTEMEPALIANSAFFRFAIDGALDETSLMAIQNFQINRGYVEYKKAVPVARMSNLTFLPEAVARAAQQ
jgi:NitT/TauT family transport system substrate-binding protein